MLGDVDCHPPISFKSWQVTSVTCFFCYNKIKNRLPAPTENRPVINPKMYDNHLEVYYIIFWMQNQERMVQMAKYKKRADGRYYTLVSTKKLDEKGKPIRIPVYAKSSRELEE